MNVQKIVESSKDNSVRMQEVNASERLCSSGTNPSCAIIIDTSKSYQKFLGFGGALTESAGYVLSLLPKEKRQEVLSSYFASTESGGNNYTFARTHLNSCDFSLGNWACVEEKDETLSSFSMEKPDLYLTPLMQDAQKAKGSPLSILLSPWSPPAWMKDNGEMNHGGHLLSQYRELWAAYFVRYIQELKKRNLETAFVTVQNEAAANQPWDSCLWSAKEEGLFVAENLGPALERAKLKAGILVWDHNRDLLAERFEESMSVPGGDKYIAGAAYHWYSGDQYENVKSVSRKFPDRQLIFTEGCVEGGPRNGAWFTGERYAHNIINDLNSGATGWIDWNIALNMEGGPNHVGNNCDAPVLVDTKEGTLHYQSSFYAIGHFSRYILPESRRVELSMTPYMTPATVDGRMGNTMEATAFIRPDKKTVIVISNRTEADMVYDLSIDGASSVRYKAPPRSIQTLCF